jgi:hypothetical protein
MFGATLGSMDICVRAKNRRTFTVRSAPSARIVALLVCVAVFFAGCATHSISPTCPAGTGSPMRVYELYFGRAIDGRGDLTDAEWDEFRNSVIIPNLPRGFTVLNGEGAWLNPHTHTTISEASKIVVTAMPDTAGSMSAIARVREAYDTKFHQISVGMTSHVACGAFN